MDQSDNSRDELSRVQEYRKLVLLYEALDEEIDKLIMAHGGTTEKMTDEDLARYRQLARQRDELLNDMRSMEQELLLSDDNDVWKRAEPPSSKGNNTSDYRPNI
ncbi:MAG: hypothetical protein H7175_16610 [Burkholderiales bacterium]|nr:hypothetical protein [Anaerolineae bacterium]